MARWRVLFESRQTQHQNSVHQQNSANENNSNKRCSKNISKKITGGSR